jgi:hypothetical protein
MSVLVNWVLISIIGIIIHHISFPNGSRDKIDTILYIIVYFFSSPVIHFIIWCLQGKPLFNFKSIVLFLIYILLCINLLINIL